MIEPNVKRDIMTLRTQANNSRCVADIFDEGNSMRTTLLEHAAKLDREADRLERR